MSSEPIAISRANMLSVATAMLIAGSLAVAFIPKVAPPTFEGRDYLAIAQFDYSHVNTYYGGRVLHPLTVRLVAKAMGSAIDGTSFLWVSIASLLTLFALLAVYHCRNRSGSWPWLLLIATPVVLDQYRNYYWPELFHAALCAAFFLVLSRNRWASLPILFLLYMARESTIVLVIVIVILALRFRFRVFALAVSLVGIVGMTVNSMLVAASQPNRHGIPLFLLDALKIPYNFALNMLGLEFWVNTNADTTQPPIWKTNLPAWLHLGSIQQIGYSGFHVAEPVALLLLLLTSFGVLPLVVIAGMRRWKAVRFDQRVAFAYGGAMLVLTPLVGTTPYRYIFAAWPLFWIVGVLTLSGQPQARLKVIALSVAVSWSPALVRFASRTTINQTNSLSELPLALSLVVIAVAFLAYAGAWHLVGRAVSGEITAAR